MEWLEAFFYRWLNCVSSLLCYVEQKLQNHDCLDLSIPYNFWLLVKFLFNSNYAQLSMGTQLPCFPIAMDCYLSANRNPNKFYSP